MRSFSFNVKKAKYMCDIFVRNYEQYVSHLISIGKDIPLGIVIGNSQKQLRVNH